METCHFRSLLKAMKLTFCPLVVVSFLTEKYQLITPTQLKRQEKLFVPATTVIIIVSREHL